MYLITISNPIGGLKEFVAEVDNPKHAEEAAEDCLVHALDEVYLIQFIDEALAERLIARLGLCLN